MALIVLTVQPTNSIWRLGLKTSDSNDFFKHRENVKFILPETKEFCVKTACGTSSKKAFDFNGKQIGNWIVKNGFNNYSSRKPTKLEFNITESRNIKTLTFKRKKT